MESAAFASATTASADADCVGVGTGGKERESGLPERSRSSPPAMTGSRRAPRGEGSELERVWASEKDDESDESRERREPVERAEGDGGRSEEYTRNGDEARLAAESACSSTV